MNKKELSKEELIHKRFLKLFGETNPPVLFMTYAFEERLILFIEKLEKELQTTKAALAQAYYMNRMG